MNWAGCVTKVTDAVVRVYNRLETTVTPIPDEPVLFVANHGFGGVFDLNVGSTSVSSA